MNLLVVKQAGVVALGVVNLSLFVWSLVSYRQRRSLPDGYYRLLAVSPLIAAFQAGMGIVFLVEGRLLQPMHLFYGILVTAGAVMQVVVRPGLAVGQKYRGRPAVHAALSLFVALVAIRSWMSG